MHSAFPLSHLSTQFEQFFSAALHLLLCVKGVYPKETFTRKRKFGCLSWWSESPQLCQYVSQVAGGIRDLILKKLLAKIVVVLLASEHAAEDGADMPPSSLLPGEKFVFELTNFDSFWSSPSVFGPVTTNAEHGNPPVRMDSQMSHTGMPREYVSQRRESAAQESVVADEHIHECFRDVLMKLQYSDVLGPKNWKRSYNYCSFSVQVETRIHLDPSSRTLSEFGGHVDQETIARIKATWLPSQNVLEAPPTSAEHVALIEDSVAPLHSDGSAVDAVQLRRLKTVKVKLRSTGRVANILQVSLEGEVVPPPAQPLGTQPGAAEEPALEAQAYGGLANAKHEIKNEEDLCTGLDELL